MFEQAFKNVDDVLREEAGCTTELDHDKALTGVDARNIRNIVPMRPINSIIEFKQIIGRGTRLYEGKDYFTIYDFVKTHHHLAGPEWGSEPLDPGPCEKYRITPASGQIQRQNPARRAGGVLPNKPNFAQLAPIQPSARLHPTAHEPCPERK